MLSKPLLNYGLQGNEDVQFCLSENPSYTAMYIQFAFIEQNLYVLVPADTFVTFNTRVFATGIKVEKLPQGLLSRFTKLHFAPYTEQEFIEVSQRVLTTRENTNLENAEYTARVLGQLHGQNADVRQCVQTARLSPGHRQRIDEVLVALRKHSG